MMNLLEEADAEPTSQAVTATAALQTDLKQLLASWEAIKAGK